MKNKLIFSLISLLCIACGDSSELPLDPCIEPYIGEY